jgi:Acetyltransferase (GNAT) domain
VTVTAAADAFGTEQWPVGAATVTGPRAEPSLTTVETAYGRRAVAAVAGDIGALAMSCDAPLTARPAWSLATSDATTLLEPWAVLARDAAGMLVGAVVLHDHIQDPRAVLTTLAGTDGGQRGAILTSDATVALALGDAVRAALDAQSTPSTVILGPLPAGNAVVHAFSAGLSGSTEDAAAAVPVIRRAAGTEPDDYLAAGMRRSLRKATNRLAADECHAQTRFTTDAAEIVALVPHLERVHRQRDHMHGRISDLDDAVRHRAWRHRVRNLIDVGLLELAVLEIDGDLAAYTLGVVDGPVYRLLEGRFVTRWSRYSPGRLLELAVVERFLADSSLMTFDWMTAVAPESLLGRNDADPMVLVQLG